MATLEQLPSMPPTAQTDIAQREIDTSPGPLNSLLARAYTVNWEAIFYIGLFILTILTRFVNLGDRVASHDESLHMKYSNDLYQQGIFSHTPLMHGPLLFHAVALNYLLFGANDFTARLYPAILGSIMVFMPLLLFRRWLGKFGAMVASVLILISPMLLFHARYIREDTPAIFFTILMVYSIFAYIDGVKPRQPRFLILFAAATLLNLASKETAFMYIAVFGLLLVIFLAFQIIQGWRAKVLDGSVGWAILGVVTVPTVAGISMLLYLWLRQKLNMPAPVVQYIGNLQISPLAQQVALAVIVGVPISLLVTFGIFSLVRGIWNIGAHSVGESFVNAIAARGNSLFRLILAGMTIGVVLALAFTFILSIIKPENIATSRDAWSAYDKQQAALTAQPAQGDQSQPLLTQPTDPRPEVLTTRTIVWGALAILVIAFVVVLTMLARFSRLPNLPWWDVLIIGLVAFGVTFALVRFEERSRVVPNVSSEARGAVTEYNDTWIAGSWVVGVASVIGLLALRFRSNFFQEMRRYAAFDLIMVVGTLVLPWLAAIPIFAAGYPLDANSYPPEVITSCIIGAVPFVLVAIVAGLCWEPTLWMICAATFYGLFAFFYTTIFTNPNGIATGMIGSLGYWLTQQGVRRGSQPQYYYMVVELPIYEYLPLIGAAFAGVIGMLTIWRFRANRYSAALELAQANASNGDSSLQPLPETEGEFRSEEAFNSEGETEPGLTLDSVQAELEAQPVASLQDLPDVPLSELDAQAQTRQENLGAAATNVAKAARFTRQGGLLGFLGLTSMAGLAIADVSQKATAWGDVSQLSDPFADAPDGGGIAAIEQVSRFPFVAFVGLWAVFIIFFLTVAGEKMPWLTTHMTLPLGLITGWYVGTQLEKINWNNFWKQGWAVIILTPILLIGLANLIGPYLLKQNPFAGLTREEQLRTFTWMGAGLVVVIVIYALYRIGRLIGLSQLLRIGLVSFFVLLSLLTARTAWMAAYINYDEATEFMVYAHGAPAYKTVLNVMMDISRRTSDGMNIKIAYDDLVSWPGSWYFRVFPKATFLGDASNPGNLDDNLVIVLGKDHAQKLDAQLAGKYDRYDLIRMWWPMQDYFDLNLTRIDNSLSNPAILNGMWDIWWNRDYNAYAAATNTETDPTRKADQDHRFDLDRWPVSDHFVYFVRKDITAQLWGFSSGAAKVTGLGKDPFADLRCDICTASLAFSPASSPLAFPRGVTVGPDGNVYLADTENGRIIVYNQDGQMINTFGKGGAPDTVNPPPGTMREPWSVAVAKDGTIFVADTWYHRIQVFAKDGTPLRQWGHFEKIEGAATSGTEDGFYGPRDIKIDAQGRVYVADTGNKRIRVYSAQGKLLSTIGSSGPADGQLNEPVGITINDKTGEMFVADSWNRRIQVFNIETGAFLRKWDMSPAWAAITPSTDNGNRPLISLDRSGNFLFVVDPDTARVLVYDTNGAAKLSFGRVGGEPFTSLSQFKALSGITVDPQSGRLFLVDSGSGRVVRFEPDALPGLTASNTSNPQQGQPGDVVTQAATESAVQGQAGQPVQPIATQAATSNPF